jgi:chromosome segregation ATPase
MPVKQIFDKKEDAPEWLRGSLLEQDGKFVFEAELPTETAGLKSALQKEREAKAAAEKTLKGFEGIDPEEARKLKAEAEKIETEKLKSKGDWETREKQLKEELAADLQKRESHFQTELKTRDDRITKLQTSLEKSLIEAQATTAIAAISASMHIRRFGKLTIMCVRHIGM